LKKIISHNYSLIERCKKGEHPAQLQIYKQYYKAMYNIAFRIVGNSSEAEDIMQESFLAAFTKLDSFSGAVTFGAWLKRIVVNNSITSFNKTKKMNVVSLDNTNQEIANETQDSIAFLQIKMPLVLECIKTLKDNYKIILTLYFIEGYDYQELSVILKISNQNCRTLISRAKAQLRKKLVQINANK